MQVDAVLPQQRCHVLEADDTALAGSQARVCGLVPGVWQSLGALERSLLHLVTSWACLLWALLSQDCKSTIRAAVRI